MASLLTDCPGVYSPVVAGVPHSVLAASIFLTDYFGTAKLLLCVGQYKTALLRPDPNKNRPLRVCRCPVLSVSPVPYRAHWRLDWDALGCTGWTPLPHAQVSPFPSPVHAVYPGFSELFPADETVLGVPGLGGVTTV